MTVFSIVPIEVLQDDSLTATEIKMIVCLLSFRNKNTNLICPSTETIAKRMGLKDKTRVSKITTSLCKKGWLNKKKAGFDKSNKYEFIVPERFEHSQNDETSQHGDIYQIDETDQDGDICQVGENDQIGKNHQRQFGQNSQVQFGQNSQPNKQNNKQDNKNPVESEIPRCPQSDIIQLYHDTLPELPRVIVSLWRGSTREKHLTCRWRQDPEFQTLKFWQWFFSRVKSDAFMLGQNDRGWRTDLGWLVKKQNFEKTVERYVSQEAA